MRFSDKKFFWVGRKVENQVKTFAEDGCTHCFNKYEIPEDFLFLLGFSAVLAGRRDQLYKLWGDSCSYTSQISSVPSESLILTTQVSCNCFTLNSIQNFQNIKHIITAAYESVRARHSSHLFVGIISPSHWASATESVLKLGLPWRVLRPQLVSSTKNGMVDYQEWMKELSITEPKLEVTHLLLRAVKPWKMYGTPKYKTCILSWQISDTSLLETMYKNHSNLETIFRIIDTDHSG